MTRFRAVAPQQEPFEIGLDDSGRVMFAFNVIATKAASTSWLEEAIAVLQAAGLANVVGGPKAVVPRDGSWITVRATGGVAPEGTVENPVAWRRPGAQIIARAPSAAEAEALALAAYAAYAAVRNTDVVVA